MEKKEQKLETATIKYSTEKKVDKKLETREVKVVVKKEEKK